MPSDGRLEGQQLQARELAAHCRAVGWDSDALITAVAVCLSESQGYLEAKNDNIRELREAKPGMVVIDYERAIAELVVYEVVSPEKGEVSAFGETIYLDPGRMMIFSRDCGAMQINIPAELIGTEAEAKLYEPEYNFTRAFALYKRRKFEPWYGFTRGYATSVDWWYWSTKREMWRPTGRYLHRAIRGVANERADEFAIPNRAGLLDFHLIPPAPLEPPEAKLLSARDPLFEDVMDADRRVPLRSLVLSV